MCNNERHNHDSEEEEIDLGRCVHGCTHCGQLWECIGICSFENMFDIICGACFEQTNEVN